MSEPTADPITWQLLVDVQNAIKLVQVSRHFYTDLGLGMIALEPMEVPEDDDAEFTLIVGTNIDVDDENSTRSMLASEMDVTIEYAIPFTNADAMKRAHRARNDLIRALIPLRKDIKDRPLCVRDFKITGTSITPPADGSSYVIAQVLVRAGLSESTKPAN